MLSDHEAMEALCADFPQICTGQHQPEEKKACSLFYACAVYAVKLIQTEEWESLRDCLYHIDELYSQSSERIRTFIENIFVYKLGDQAQLSKHRDRLGALMPDQLKHLLRLQFITSNI